MSVVWSVCKRQAKEISHDGMMMMMAPVPVLIAVLMKFGIPWLNEFLAREYDKVQMLEPYYLIFDMVIAIATPLMLCIVYAMVLMTEFDDKVAHYLIITPIRIQGYLTASLVLPGVFGCTISGILLYFFSLTEFTLMQFVILILLSFVLSIICCLFVVGLSSNKVEGIAFSKFTSFFILGVPAPFFIHSNIQYVVGILPTFWVTKYLLEDNACYLIGFLISTAFWMILLLRKFMKKF